MPGSDGDIVGDDDSDDNGDDGSDDDGDDDETLVNGAHFPISVLRRV